MKNRPSIYVIPPKEGAAPGPGDRLLARLEKHGDSYEARIIRRLEREAPDAPDRRAARNASDGWRLVPIDKKARTEYALDKSRSGRRQDTMNWLPPNPRRAASPVLPASRLSSASAAWTSPRPSA